VRQSTDIVRARATQIVPSGSTPKMSVGPKICATVCLCGPKSASPNSGTLSRATVSTVPPDSFRRSTGKLSFRIWVPGSAPPVTVR
jgi:hypothetical protein